MRLKNNLINNQISRRLINFSIVFTLFFSCFTIFFADTTKAEQPTITIDSPVSNSNIYDKTPTIKVIYYAAVGINLDSIILKLDNEDVTNSATITSNGIIYTPATELVPGSHAVSLTVSDTLNNTAIKSWSFTIIESESSIEKDSGEINPNVIKEIIINEGITNQIVIEKIIINSIKNLEKTNLFIAKLSTRSNEITRPKITDTSLIITGAGYTNINTQTLRIYSYLDIEFTSNSSKVKETDISSVTIIFKIEKSWIESNNVDKKNIKLLRYNDNVWQELSTTYYKEDGTYVYYNAITKGFSIFAVIGSEKTVEEQSVGINLLLIIGGIILIILIIFAILFKIGYLYIETNPETYYVSKSGSKNVRDEEIKRIQKEIDKLKSDKTFKYKK